MKKRVLPLLLALCMILTALPVASFAAETNAEVPGTIAAECLGGEIKNLTASEERPTLNATYYDTPEAAGAYMVPYMVRRQDTISVSVVFPYSGNEEQLEEWGNMILARTVKYEFEAKTGDYLLLNAPIVEYEYEGSLDDENNAFVDYTFTFTYLTTAEQEEKVDQAVTKIIKDLGLNDMLPYNQVKAVYDYICANVKYEGIVTEDTEIIKMTAYSALVNGTATDYGIASALYRLANELGLTCRAFFGKVDGEDRFWNSMNVDGWDYYVDAALDSGAAEPKYFLKGSKSMPNHVADESFIPTGGVYEQGYCIQELDFGPDFGHQYGEEKVVKEATCTATGISQRMCTCGYTVEQTIPLGKHTKPEKGTVTKEPTCAEEGVMTYVCTVCGHEETEAIPVVEHDYAEGVVTKEPTCAEKGTATYTCKVCGRSYTKELEMIPHTYESAVTKEPTCTDVGVQTHTCKDCGHSYTSNIDPTGHDYVSKVTKESTCAVKGEMTYTCKICGYTHTEELELLEHVYESSVTREPTCEKEGVRTFSCTSCSDYYTEPIAVIDHNFKNDVCTGCGAGAVYRISGASRFETAYATADVLKETLGLDKFKTIIVASGENFADALTGSYLAAVRKAPIILYGEKVLDDNVAYITENLAEGGRVCVLGGTSSVSQKLDDALKAKGIDVQRFAGSNRFETNLAILEAAGVTNQEILVCTADTFADSLSASAAGLPILLVDNKTGTLTEGQKAFLKDLKDNDITIIGGENSVSKTLEEALGEYGEVDRISGGSREETSAWFADKYFEAPEYALVAYSWNFPDGLCGGPLAYAMGAPLLLASEGGEEMAQAYIEYAEIIKGYVLGGAATIKDASVRIVFNMKDNVQIMTK